MTTTGWEGLLEEGETILWQGKPKPGLDVTQLIDGQTLMGIFFTGFATFWVQMASGMVSDMRGAPGIFKLFPLFGLIFVAIGLNMVFGRHIWAAYKRGNTFYTLTTKAAFIATKSLGKRELTRYALEDMSEISLTDGNPGSVHFDKGVSHHNTAKSGNRTTVVQIGFLRIEDARQVHRMLIEAQRDA